VNSYWDDGAHIPFDARRPLRELGGRPLHDVSVRLRGPIVKDFEALFSNVWNASGSAESAIPGVPSSRTVTHPAVRPAGMRVVCDAPDGILPDTPNGSMQMLAELLAGIARARSFIYIEHQYLTSRPIVAALADALRLTPALEIIIVLNQNPDLTAYRAWQNLQLAEHALLGHPRVGVFTLWSTDAHPTRTDVRRINQLFIHSKVIVVDDEWAAVGTSNLDGVSMGDYGADFAGALGRHVFRGVRNVEVNVVIDARDASGSEVDAIRTLRERLWSEHLGASRVALGLRATGGWVAMWREAARENVRVLSNRGARMIGRVLPYSASAYPRDQLLDIGVDPALGGLELCYNPTWFGVHLSPHWIRNIF
jgi:phosphatidylserine/phosphatidylglycerophosphate/cardiolipin synthase-like enzyme